ncbi:MAG: GumC family protein [Candidatus Acidiferrales bacterium]
MSTDTMDQPIELMKEYWQSVRRSGWWIFLTTLWLTLAMIVVIALLPDQYQATTTILVDPQMVSDQYVTPPVKELLTDRLQTITQQVLSTTRLQEVIDHYHLYPELRNSMSRDEIVAKMRENVNIEVKHASGNGPGSFTITYQGRNPVVVAQVANDLATRFIAWNLQSTEQVAESTTQFLNEQLDEAKNNLETQEQKAREFKMSHLGEMPDNLPANLGTLGQLRATYQTNNDALNRLEQERFELTRLPIAVPQAGTNQYIPGLSQRERLTMERDKLQDQLTDLRRRYTATYPEVIDVTARLQHVQEELKALPGTDSKSASEPSRDLSPTAVRLELISREMKRLTEEQKVLGQQMATYQSKVDAMPLREQQLTDVTRDYEMSKDQYKNLLSKKYAAEMAGDLERKQKGERFTILDAAEPPQKPVKPNRGMMMVGSLFASFAFSIVLVIAKDKLDPRVRAEREVNDMLPASVSMLATIPSIVTPSDRRRRVRFAVFALTTSVFACLLVV